MTARRAPARGIILLFAGALLVGCVLAGVGTAAATQQEEPPSVEAVQTQPASDATVTEIQLEEDGTATWTLEIRTRLESTEDEENFERFQASFRENRSEYIDTYRERMTNVVASAAESRSRSMAATDFEAETTVETVPHRWGVVTYRFQWHGFAATQGDRIDAGDVFEGGFYLDRNSVLEIELPESYESESVAPEPDERGDRRAEWHGQKTFEDGHPRVVATPVDDARPAWQLPLVGLFLAIGTVVVWQYGFSQRLLADDTDDEHTTTAAASTESQPPESGPLSDSDEVRRVLHEHGGRCKQSQIVAELDWSKSKTSRVLSRMDEEDTVEKLRLGRENLVELLDDGRSRATDD